MDLEGHARRMFKNNVPKDEIIQELSELTGSDTKAEAILTEIINSENITDSFIRDLCGFTGTGFTAEDTGLGCRGEGDFLIHRKLAQLIDDSDTIVNPRDQDDGGVVQLGKDFLIVSVDGMHSRLSHFPFIAGFHATRAAIRDTLVMGSQPKALLSDIHLANDGDVAKIFDYTAGIAVVSELSNIPLIAGSTLRIGGDLVLGDRLTGCVGCVGYGRNITPRRSAEPGDVLLMTEGHGGGTIATTAIYNGRSEIVKETLNLKNINLALHLLDSTVINNIHSLTDVTNGGIRGDAFEISKTAKVRIKLFEDEFNRLINPLVLDMLTKLKIDPLGVSIDSLLIILPETHVEQTLRFIREHGSAAAVVGVVEAAKDDKSSQDSPEPAGQQFGVRLIGKMPERKSIELKPSYREEPYTPIKKVVDIAPKDQEKVKNAIESAVLVSLTKRSN